MAPRKIVMIITQQESIKQNHSGTLLIRIILMSGIMLMNMT